MATVQERSEIWAEIGLMEAALDNIKMGIRDAKIDAGNAEYICGPGAFVRLETIELELVDAEIVFKNIRRRLMAIVKTKQPDRHMDTRAKRG